MNEPNKGPCYQCPERHRACHDSCPRYQAWKAERERQKENARADRQYPITANHARKMMRLGFGIGGGR